MKWIAGLLFLVSCNEARVKELFFTPLNSGILCRRITHENTLKGCDKGVDEIINATNIIKVER